MPQGGEKYLFTKTGIVGQKGFFQPQTNIFAEK